MGIDDLIRMLEASTEGLNSLSTRDGSTPEPELSRVLREAAGGLPAVPTGWSRLQRETERMLQSATGAVESRGVLTVTGVYVLASQPYVRLSAEDPVVHGIYRRALARARHTCQVCGRAGRVWGRPESVSGTLHPMRRVSRHRCRPRRGREFARSPTSCRPHGSGCRNSSAARYCYRRTAKRRHGLRHERRLGVYAGCSPYHRERFRPLVRLASGTAGQPEVRGGTCLRTMTRSAVAVPAPTPGGDLTFRNKCQVAAPGR